MFPDPGGVICVSWKNTKTVKARRQLCAYLKMCNILSVLRLEEWNTIKYLSSREFPEAKPEGFPDSKNWYLLVFLDSSLSTVNS